MSALGGRVVATTRGGEPGDPLVASLEAHGARVLVWPTLRFTGPRDPGPLSAAAAALARYDWLVFTSARAVRALAQLAAPIPPPERYGRRRTDVPRTGDPRVAAVGPATADALRAAGWRVDVVGGGGARLLVDAIAERHALDGAAVLFPAGSLAHHRLEEGLHRRGAGVERVEAYRTVPAPPDRTVVTDDLRRGVDVVTFTSPSAVRVLCDALGGELAGPLSGCGVAAIGPTTASALAAEGVTRVVIAASPTPRGLVDACAFLMRRERAS